MWAFPLITGVPVELTTSVNLAVGYYCFTCGTFLTYLTITITIAPRLSQWTTTQASPPKLLLLSWLAIVHTMWYLSPPDPCCSLFGLMVTTTISLLWPCSRNSQSLSLGLTCPKFAQQWDVILTLLRTYILQSTSNRLKKTMLSLTWWCPRCIPFKSSNTCSQKVSYGAPLCLLVRALFALATRNPFSLIISLRR